MIFEQSPRFEQMNYNGRCCHHDCLDDLRILAFWIPGLRIYFILPRSPLTNPTCKKNHKTDKNEKIANTRNPFRHSRVKILKSDYERKASGKKAVVYSGILSGTDVIFHN